MVKIQGGLLMGAFFTMVALSNKPETGFLILPVAIVGLAIAYNGHVDICNADYENCPNCGCANAP
jgi:hypothetical protein